MTEFFTSVLADFRENWPVYALMPVFAAVIGYITKLAAVEMLFRPIEFRGIKPFLGWQGIIPRFAPRMAATAMDLMLARLISPQEILDKIDPDEFIEHVQQPLTDAVDELTSELMLRYQPTLWEAMPQAGRQLLLRRVRAEAPKVIKRMVRDLRKDIDQVFDLREMAVNALIRDKAKLVRLIRLVGKTEMRFIVYSGPFFGFLLGVVQVVVWSLTHSRWVMPTFGAFVGYFTDWVALTMIFRPVQPRRFLGVFRWQGLFHKRRDEVARDYGTLIATEILTPANIIDAMLTGPQSDRLFELISREVQRTIDQQLGFAKPLLVVAVGGREYQQLKRDAVRIVLDRLPETAREVEDYVMEAVDVRNTVVSKFGMMTSEEYENVLRPAFKQDEWKILLVGAVLGFLVGELQVVLLLS